MVCFIRFGKTQQAYVHIQAVAAAVVALVTVAMVVVVGRLG